MSLLELLEAEDVTTFNNTRGERARVELFASDLADKRLVGVDLSAADCEKSDFTGTDLSQATLMKTRFDGIDGTGMKLVDAMAVRATFRGAWMDEADLTGADLAQANFTEANLSNSVASATSLVRAKLKDTDLSGAKWAGVDLNEAQLTRAKCHKADLSRVTLVEASGAVADFTEARLDAVVASGARMPEAVFKGASLMGAKFDGANLSKADFTGANLIGVDFTGANLTGAVFEGAQLGNAVFAEACLEEVTLAGLDLEGVDLTGLDADVLGLSEDQREQVVAVGVMVNPDAALAVNDPKVARFGEQVIAVWLNDDGMETKSLRFAVVGPEGARNGVVPVTGEGVLAFDAVTTDAGFEVLVTRERADGVVLTRFTVSAVGVLGGGVTRNFGYAPMVKPLFRRVDGNLKMFGVARRGPTVVISGDGEEGMVPQASKQVPTAQRFLSRRYPVLSCKGGVAMPLTVRGPGGPLRTPDSFPGQLPQAVQTSEDILVVWFLPRVGERPCGLRYARLAGRGSPEVEELSERDGVLSVDAIADGDGAWVVWVEAMQGAETRLMAHRIPDGEPMLLAPSRQDLRHVRFAEGADGAWSICAITDSDTLVVLDAVGAVAHEIGG